MFMKGIAPFEQAMIYSVLVMAVVALVMLIGWHARPLRPIPGRQPCKQIWGHIRDGANMYLTTQMKTIAILIVVLTIAMFLSVAWFPPTGEANELFCGAAVEEALAANIAANTSLSASEVLHSLETQTPQAIAAGAGYAALKADRVAASVELPIGSLVGGNGARFGLCHGGDVLGNGRISSV